MEKLTDKELAVINAIAYSEYNSSGEFLDFIWVFSVWDNVDKNVVKSRSSIGGIVASLSNKKLVVLSAGDTVKEDVIRLTKEAIKHIDIK